MKPFFSKHPFFFKIRKAWVGGEEGGEETVNVKTEKQVVIRSLSVCRVLKTRRLFSLMNSLGTFWFSAQ